MNRTTEAALLKDYVAGLETDRAMSALPKRYRTARHREVFKAVIARSITVIPPSSPAVYVAEARVAALNKTLAPQIAANRVAQFNTDVNQTVSSPRQKIGALNERLPRADRNRDWRTNF